MPSSVDLIADLRPGITVRPHRSTGLLNHRPSPHRLATHLNLAAHQSLAQAVVPAITSLLGYHSRITPSPAATLQPGPTPPTLRRPNYPPSVFVISLCLSDLVNSKQTSAHYFALCQSVSTTVSLTSTFASEFPAMPNSASFSTQGPH
jgi:hypothetical protein